MRMFFVGGGLFIALMCGGLYAATGEWQGIAGAVVGVVVAAIGLFKKKMS